MRAIRSRPGYQRRTSASILRRLRLRLQFTPGLFNNGRVHRSASLRANTTLKVGRFSFAGRITLPDIKTGI